MNKIQLEIEVTEKGLESVMINRENEQGKESEEISIKGFRLPIRTLQEL